jgi:hypothetical protein
MDRRTFLEALAGGLLAVILSVSTHPVLAACTTAQEACRIPVVGNDGKTRYKIACCNPGERCGSRMYPGDKTASPFCSKPPTCKQCQFADCLKETIARNNAIIEGYRDLARQFAVGYVVDGNPADQVDIGGLNPSARQKTYRALLDSHKQFLEAVSDMANRIPGTNSCAYTGPLEVATDSYETCAIDPSMEKTLHSLPCGELGDSMRAHETFHQQSCRVRQGRGQGYWPYTATGNDSAVTKYLPPMMLTPAGLAKEEIAAYQAQNATLAKLLQAANQNCR